MTVQLDVGSLVASLSTTAALEVTDCAPCAQAAETDTLKAENTQPADNTTPDIVETDAPQAVIVDADTEAKDSDIKWEGILGFEGVLTGDGRFIMPDSLRWETLPLPIRVVFADVGAHDGARVIGHIRKIERKPIKSVPNAWALWGEGTFDSESDAGKEAIRMVERELSNGISMDLDDVSFEVRVADQIPKSEAKEDTEALDVEGLSALPGMSSKVLAKVSPTDEVTVTTSGRIRAATLVSIAAFAAAKIHLAKEKDADVAFPTEDSEDDEDKPKAPKAVVAASYAMPTAGDPDAALQGFAEDEVLSQYIREDVRDVLGTVEQCNVLFKAAKNLITPVLGADPTTGVGRHTEIPSSGDRLTTTPRQEYPRGSDDALSVERSSSSMPSLLQSVTDSAEALSAVLVGLSTSKSGRAETQKALEPKNASAELSVSGVSMMKATSDFSRAAVMYAGNSQQKLGATEALSHDTTSTTAMRVEGTEGSSAPTATHLQDLLATVQNDFESLLTTWNSTGATFDNDPHTNWIEETGTGHLPPYIRQIADALLRTGADESHAIATAVNTVKRWARGGTVRANGGPNVLPDTAAKAAAAIAEWEAKRAEAGANAAETTTLASGPVVVSAPESAPDPEPQYTPEQLEVLARAMKLKFQMFRDFTPKQREKAAEDGTAMPGGSFPIKNREDLKNAIQAAGRAKDFEAVKRHIKKRARELDLEKLLPEDWAVDVLMVV